MKTVNVSRDELKGRIKANLDQHKKDYAQACEDYADAVSAQLVKNRDKVLAEFDAEIARVKAAGLTPVHPNISSPTREIRSSIPVSHTKEYEKAIAMLDMSQDETVELGDHDFSKFVLDDWEWKEEFRATSAMYDGLAKQHMTRR